ncbi:protein amalgam-like isoform X2 [Acropora muricata]|uniref:protein amalgam-like isoform X2 n=1 Tax=Acropora muricata TaxID=159855 RepID=UPI0034E44089
MGYSHGTDSAFSCIIVCSVAIFRSTDGGSITWFEPPPFETVTDPSSIATAYINLTKGFADEELSCNFSLSADLSLVAASIKLGGSSVASFVQDQRVLSIQPGFENRFNVTWVPTKLTLILLDVTSAEEGEYRCEVLSVGSLVQTWARTIQASLLVSPRITEISKKIVPAIEGGNVTLKCVAEGKPMPSVIWTRPFDNSVVTMPLVGISRHDVRDYRCTAQNGVGNPDIRNITIDVQYPVETTGIGKNVTVVKGTEANISCPVAGNPQPNITWYKGSELGGVKISHGKKLTVKEKIEMSLCYVCVASNSLGKPVNITQCFTVGVGESFLSFIRPTGITPKGKSNSIYHSHNCSRPSPMDCYWYCGRSFCLHGYFSWSWSDMVRVHEGKMQKGHKTARKKT